MADDPANKIGQDTLENTNNMQRAAMLNLSSIGAHSPTSSLHSSGMVKEILEIQKLNIALELKDSEKLHGRPNAQNNWPEFLYHLTSKFEGFDLWDPDHDRPKMIVTRHHIAQNLSSELQRLTREFKTTETLWQHLVQGYSSSHARQQPQVVEALIELHPTEDMDIELVALRDMISTVKASFGDTINTETLVHLIWTKNLPKWYEHDRREAYKNTPFNFSLLEIALRNTWQDLAIQKNRQKKSFYVETHPATQAVSSSTGNDPNRCAKHPDRKKTECWLCNPCTICTEKGYPMTLHKQNGYKCRENNGSARPIPPSTNPAVPKHTANIVQAVVDSGCSGHVWSERIKLILNFTHLFKTRHQRLQGIPYQ